LVIVSQTLSHPVIINSNTNNRNDDYDIFNQQVNIHLDINHKVVGIKRCHHGMSV